MKILRKYILREILPLFVISNLFIMFILLFDKLINLASLFFAKGVAGTLIIKTILFYIPSFLVISIPISTLISVMTAFSRFSSDSELIVMKASGVPASWFLRITSSIGFIFFIMAAIVSLWLMPLGNKLSIENLKSIASSISISDINENELYEEIPGVILLVEKKKDKFDFENIVIIQKNENLVITAKSGEIFSTKDGAISFNLNTGEINKKDNEKISKIKFEQFSLNFDLNLNDVVKIKDERVMPLDSLIKNQNKGYIYKFELSKRIALPFSCIIMAVFGMLLGSFFTRGGRTLNLFAAIAVVFSYNTILVFSENMAKIGLPYISAWYANIIFTIICLFFYKRFRV
ncbi:LptF/LptG family permease [Deferribacterales bacterium Es71-Z0220]|uniref:LptF/LptG family permease n=1 Tax=Deferrivibrio essentukiensis TaxID=2880922 RepID=UPI001F60EA64|nr:LptF/LptG family permease [Deferrivibrio essentukiensis]MCB4204285.1 LptF/LptG family permease [Deferrivibrio essentukiensis]